MHRRTRLTLPLLAAPAPAQPWQPSGTIRVVVPLPAAGTTEGRSRMQPDAQTAAEQGYRNAAILGWNSLFAPARTPQTVPFPPQARIAAAARHLPLATRIDEPGGENCSETSRSMVHEHAASLPALRMAPQ